WICAFEQVPMVQEWAVLNTADYLEVYAVCAPIEWRAISELQAQTLCHCDSLSKHERFKLIRDDAIINLFRTVNRFGPSVLVTCRRHLAGLHSFLSSLLSFVSQEALRALDCENPHNLEFSQFDRFIHHKQLEQSSRLARMVAGHWDGIRKRHVDRAWKRTGDF